MAGRIDDLTGARSANRYRFWRNARTYATHDSINAKNALIGACELSGEFPNSVFVFTPCRSARQSALAVPANHDV